MVVRETHQALALEWSEASNAGAVIADEISPVLVFVLFECSCGFRFAVKAFSGFDEDVFLSLISADRICVVFVPDRVLRPVNAEQARHLVGPACGCPDGGGCGFAVSDSACSGALSCRKCGKMQFVSAFLFECR